MVLLLVAVLLAGAAALLEHRQGTIPLWLVAPALIVAPLAHAGIALGRHATMDVALAEAGFSVVGAIACAVLPLLLYRKQAIGGNDVVLFATLGALGQPTIGLTILVYAFVAVTLLAAAHAARTGRLRAVLAGSTALLVDTFRAKKRSPVAPESMAWSRIGGGVFLGTVVALVLQIRSAAE